MSSSEKLVTNLNQSETLLFIIYSIRVREFLLFVSKMDIIIEIYPNLHLADAFIQSNLQCIQAIHFFISKCVPWELNQQPFALLTQCSTTEPQELENRNGIIEWLSWVIILPNGSKRKVELPIWNSLKHCSYHLQHHQWESFFHM